MAESKKPIQIIKANVEEPENIFVPKAGRGEDEVCLVGVNGKNYNVPRAKNVTVPYAVAAEFRRAQRAQAKYDQIVNNMKGR